MLWQCPTFRSAEYSTEQDWKRALESSELSVQLLAVQGAGELAEGHGLPYRRGRGEKLRQTTVRGTVTIRDVSDRVRYRTK